MLAFCSPIQLLIHNKAPLISKPKWTSTIASNGPDEKSRASIPLIPPAARPIRKVTRQLFIQRMATIQDKKWTHKLSGCSCVLSSAAILLCAPVMSLTTGNFLAPPPHFVIQPLLYTWASSISLLSISGTVLAIRHRPNQIFERNIFVSSSLSNILSALVAIRCAATGGFVSTLVSALIITGATSSSMLILDPNVVKKKRRKKPSTASSSSISIPIPTSARRKTNSLRKNNTNNTSAFNKRSAVYSVPLLCGVIYGDVLNGLCGGIGAFILTMKDRKVISKTREYSLIASSALISIAVTVAVYSYSSTVNIG